MSEHGPRQVLPQVDGKSFRCECGANVFTEISPLHYRCNGCRLMYAGELSADSCRGSSACDPAGSEVSVFGMHALSAEDSPLPHPAPEEVPAVKPKRHLNMDDINLLAADVIEAVERFYPDLEEDFKREDELLQEITDILEEQLDPDDYPDSAYN